MERSKAGTKVKSQDGLNNSSDLVLPGSLHPAAVDELRNEPNLPL